MPEGQLTSVSGLARFLSRFVPEGVDAREPTPSWEKGLDVDAVAVAGDGAVEEGLMLSLVCLAPGSRAVGPVVDGPAGVLFVGVDDAVSLPSGFG